MVATYVKAGFQRLHAQGGGGAVTRVAALHHDNKTATIGSHLLGKTGWRAAGSEPVAAAVVAWRVTWGPLV